MSGDKMQAKCNVFLT